jgi:hypothetical protein
MSGNIKYIGEGSDKTVKPLPTSGYISQSNSDGKDAALNKFISSFTQEGSFGTKNTKTEMVNAFPDLSKVLESKGPDAVKQKLQVKQEPANSKDCSVFTVSEKSEANPDAFNEEEVSKIITDNDALKQENEILKSRERILRESYQVEKNAFSEGIASLSRPNGMSTNQKEEPSQQLINSMAKDNNKLNEEINELKIKLRHLEEQQQRKQTGEAFTSTEEPEELETISKVVTQEPPPPIRVSDLPRTMTKEEKRDLSQAQADFKLLFFTLNNRKPDDSTISKMTLPEIIIKIENLKNDTREKIKEKAVAYDKSVNSSNYKERNFSETNAERANKLEENVDELVRRYKLAFPKSSGVTPKFGGKSRRRGKRRCYTHKKTKTRRYRKRSFTRRRK